MNDLSLKTVQTVDISTPTQYWPHPENAVTFGRIVQLIKSKPGTFCFAEIKSGGFLTAELVARLVDDLKANPREIIFISFDLSALLRVKQLLPQFKCFHVLKCFTAADGMQWTKNSLDAGMDGVDLCAIPDVVTEALVQYVHSRGKEVAVWCSITTAQFNIDNVEVSRFVLLLL